MVAQSSNPLIIWLVFATWFASSLSHLLSKNYLRSHHAAAAAAKSLQSCPTLCDSIHGSPPNSPVPGIHQVRTLEWVAISFSNAWKWKVKNESEVAQSCPTLCSPMDCSPPGSSVHGIFQARVLEWDAIAFSKESSWVTLLVLTIRYSPRGSPWITKDILPGVQMT